MTPIINMLVALDLTEIDDTLIGYASYLSDQLGAEKVFFVHNIKKYEITGLIEEQLKDLNLEELIGDELNEKIGAEFTGTAEWEVLISDDPYTESLINYVVKKYHIQLTLLGNKNQVKGSGVVSGKLLRLLRCDILSIPKNFTPTMEKIWIGTDFSSASVKAFRIAEELQHKNNAEVAAVHVYKVPVHFSPYFSREEITPEIEKHLKEKAVKFLAKLKFKRPINTQILLGKEVGVAEKLRLEAEKARADVLVVADKGGNTFSSLLVGSVTEALFSQVLEIPLWIAK